MDDDGVRLSEAVSSHPHDDSCISHCNVTPVMIS